MEKEVAYLRTIRLKALFTVNQQLNFYATCIYLSYSFKRAAADLAQEEDDGVLTIRHKTKEEKVIKTTPILD